MDTRDGLGLRRMKDRERKRKQRSSLEGKRKDEESKKKYLRSFRIRKQLKEDELNELREKIRSIQKKLDRSLQRLKEKEEEVMFLQEQLEETRNRDLESVMEAATEVDDQRDSKRKECMETIDRFLQDDQDVKNMIRMTRNDFEELVNDTTESIAAVTINISTQLMFCA